MSDEIRVELCVDVFGEISVTDENRAELSVRLDQGGIKCPMRSG